MDVENGNLGILLVVSPALHKTTDKAQRFVLSLQITF